jgi:hypothetical protein
MLFAKIKCLFSLNKMTFIKSQKIAKIEYFKSIYQLKNENIISRKLFIALTDINKLIHFE